MASVDLSEGIPTSVAFMELVHYVDQYSSSDMCLQWSDTVEDINGTLLIIHFSHFCHQFGWLDPTH